MPSIRDYIDPGGRMLARRLDQFSSTLETLGERLRNTIASILGDTIGNVVRDTAMRVLDNLTGELPANPSLRRDDFENDEDAYWGDEQDEIHHAERTPDRGRLPTAVSAGLQAASWWMRRWTGQSPVATTIAAGVIAAAIAYVGGPVAAFMIGLAGTATQFIERPDLPNPHGTPFYDPH